MISSAVEAGWLSEADVQAIEKDVNDVIDEAVAFADASPEPPVEWLLTDIYKEAGAETRTGSD